MANNDANNLPAPESYEQLLSDALSAYAAKVGINDFNVGSAVLSFFEVVALITARSSGDLFQVLRDFSVDRATGDALQRLATENGVTPITASPATGNVNIIDTSFTKISTQIYAGTQPPNIGSTFIFVSDASDFPASGAIYIGRTTPNIEGPIPYIVPPVQVGGYWMITLNAPTTKFHNLGESVILAQGGNRSIPIGTIVISPAVGANPDIQYSITVPALILDGETEVDNVLVTALLPGSTGNVPIGAINEFASPPFAGATVFNPLAFTTGLDNQTDQQLRIAIKAQLASTGLGTPTAIINAVTNATSVDAQATIVSASIVLQTNGSAIVYVDNGMGYEATSQGVGLESIVTYAIGGEDFFQLATGGSQAPVAKAYIQSTLSSPFDIIGGDTLAINVGGVIYQHVFKNSDFINPGGALSYEITASINGDTTLGFEATTAGGGAYVVIRAIAETHDSIQVALPTTSGRNAAVLMGFPASLAETLRLYLNNIPLTKDGDTADVFSQQQSLWSNTITNGDTLILQVDNTAPITYTITNTDFINTGLYTSVSAQNSLASWQQVLQAKLTGVTVSISGQQLEITSNLEENNRAQVSIDPTSTLVTKGMFSVLLGLSSVGKSSDFTLDRNTAQFQLTKPLVAGDVLSAGSSQTQAMIEGGAITGSSITLPAESYFWLLTDAPGMLINTGVAPNTVIVVDKPSPDIVRYTSSVPNAFAAVLPGDYLIIWSQELNAANRLEGRVHAVTATTLEIAVTAAEYSAAVPQTIVFVVGFVVLRSQSVPRKFSLPMGTSSLDQIAALLQAQTDQLVFTVQLEESLIIRTTTTDTSGSILVVTADNNAAQLDLLLGGFSQSQTSLIAYNDSLYTDGQMPLFFHDTFAADSYANPPDSNITSVTSSDALPDTDPNNLIGFLNPYGIIPDEQPFGEYDQMASLDNTDTVIGLVPQNLVRRIRSNASALDRFFLASPLDFGNQDTLTVITDNDPTTNTFSIPLFRNARANNTQTLNPNNFNAYDTIAGPTGSFLTDFGSTFSFANYKALMQAKHILMPLNMGSNASILYRATQWGRSGTYISVGYAYPSIPNSPISSVITVGETTDITIILASGTLITTGITSTTQWNVTVTPNTPTAGIDQVTYTWNGVGTAPALTLVGGEYVNISTQTDFNAANIGVFRVSTLAGFTPNATQFSVQRPTGVAVAQTNVPTAVNGAIIFYNNSPTTANQVVAYVNANLVDITAVNSATSSGTGTIIYSTYEDNNFSSPSVQLLDGINWISVSNLGGTPQFSFKVPLAYSSDTGYTFNYQAYGVSPQGENVLLIPTTIEQVKDFMSVLAVTGFTTLGTVNVVDRGSRLELATITLGSAGAIQIIGGPANEYSVPILNSGVRIDNIAMSVSASSVASQGVSSDQWFRLAASLPQIKDTLFSSNTDITVTGNDPVTGQSLIALSNRTLTQRNFGTPRNYVRSVGNTFRIEPQGGLVCLSWDGVVNTASFTGIIAGTSTSVTLTANNPGLIGDSILLTFTGSNSIAAEIATWNGANPSNQVTLSLGNGAQVPTAGTVQLSGGSNNPQFLKSPLNFNDTGGGTYNAAIVEGSDDIQFTILSGDANFTELSIGDLLTINLTNPANNGTFLVTGVSEDGKTVEVLHQNAHNVFSNGSFTLTGNPNPGDIFGINATNLTAGTYAFFTGVPPGDATSVTISADNLGTGGNSVVLLFDGYTTTINAAITTWNALNPSNSVSLTSGDGTQIPVGTAAASYTGTVTGTSTAVTITANNVGTGGNSVTLNFDGVTSINTAITNWNTANPSNTISLTAGDGTQIPTVGALVQLSGGMGDSIDLSNGVNGQFAVGASADATALNLSSAIGAFVPGVTSGANGNVVSVVGTVVAQSVTLTYTPISTSEVTVTGFAAIPFTSGQFSASSGVSEGDSMILGPPFNVLNQGRYRIIRRYNNSVWFENPDVIEEEVTLPTNYVDLDYDDTTSFEISNFENHLYLTWNTGVGTEPLLGNALAGDIITLGSDFPVGYQGSYMVLYAGPKLQEVTQATMPAASAFTLSNPGTYWTLYSAGNVNKYYVWFNVNGTNSDPAPGGYTAGIEVDLTSTFNPVAVASAMATEINGFAGLFIATSLDNVVTITTVGYESTNPSVNVNVPLPFSVEEFQAGTATFIEAIAPQVDGLSPATVLVTEGVLVDHRPQMQFFEYEATIPGDLWVVTGNVLGASNIGSYTVNQVVDRNHIIVNGSMASIFDANLTGVETSVYIQEGFNYTGYKQVKLINSQPGTVGYNTIVFNTNAQYEKIDQAADVEMVSLNKLNFTTALINGLDSYRYNTGLIQLANKIIYGDPTDTTTYPGVGAAGADIFVQEPLSLRVALAIDIRLQTGVAFSTTSQAVRSVVGAVINSNPVGQSIALSSIVSAAAAVPGVVSVVITSPLYDAASDLIVVEPSEKTLIIDPGVDISIAQIGQ
jgi:hypothetical protein